MLKYDWTWVPVRTEICITNIDQILKTLLKARHYRQNHCFFIYWSIL